MRVGIVDYLLGADSALFVVGDDSGAPVPQSDGVTPFAIGMLTLADGQVVPFGRSRSSPAFDRQGHIYVGTDTDWVGNPNADDTFPVFICADAGGAVKWAIGLGEDQLSVVGSASPVIAQGPRGDSRAYMVASDGVAAVIEAVPGVPACPTGPDQSLLDCGGHGSCDCTTGTCACDGCWSGSADGSCSTYNADACLNGGSCDPDDGKCVCPPCFTGPLCATPVSCGAAGTCNPADGTCTCTGCATRNSFGACNVFNATAPQCGGFACVAPAGTCSCPVSSCMTGPACATPVDCGAHGSCAAGTGGCVCDACWLPDAGGLCTVANTCSGHGTCSAAGGGACVCAAGWGGAACDTRVSASASASASARVNV